MHNQNAAIKVDCVARKFRRGDRRQPVRSALKHWFSKYNKSDGASPLAANEFWAIENLSFNVSRGEAFAIIGPNGAGKSTALKLLAGIMPPTSGTLRIEGRVSALIEVGAGFHPDLTGRENIFLNASVMGLSRAETRRKFDDIVDFAGIEQFLDTPLKHYSSGMHARLGFSVAAHVEPDVLLVDEVLSVGDRVFRAKCMDRMRSFLRRGVAIIFVSHDLSAVTAFCDRAVVLDKGRTTFDGSAIDAVAHYHRACSPISPDRASDQIRVTLLTSDGTTSHSFAPRQRMTIECEVAQSNAIDTLHLRVIRMRDQMPAFETRADLTHSSGPVNMHHSNRCIRFDLALNILPAEYAIQATLSGSNSVPNSLSWETHAKLMVRGQETSGGIVEVAPAFKVIPV